MDLINKNILQDISELLDNARKQAKTAVNLSMVYAYYETGRRIFEEEQQGKERADYGEHLLKEVSDYLLKKFGKGFWVTNLKQMRKFYLTYVNDQIGQTVSDQFKRKKTRSRLLWIAIVEAKTVRSPVCDRSTGDVFKTAIRSFTGKLNPSCTADIIMGMYADSYYFAGGFELLFTP